MLTAPRGLKLKPVRQSHTWPEGRHQEVVFLSKGTFFLKALTEPTAKDSCAGPERFKHPADSSTSQGLQLTGLHLQEPKLNMTYDIILHRLTQA